MTLVFRFWKYNAITQSVLVKIRWKAFYDTQALFCKYGFVIQWLGFDHLCRVHGEGNVILREASGTREEGQAVGSTHGGRQTWIVESVCCTCIAGYFGRSRKVYAVILYIAEISLLVRWICMRISRFQLESSIEFGKIRDMSSRRRKWFLCLFRNGLGNLSD